MARKNDLTQQRFGLLTVQFRLSETENGYCLWECACDCGGHIQASTKQLKRGTITNCGCIPKTTKRCGSHAEDITGQRFGKLTAVTQVESKGGNTRWQCICDCGGTKIAWTSMLKSGKTHHCGCENNRKKDSSHLELTGMRFGRLTAIQSTDKRDSKGSVVWLCKCDYGNTAEVTADSLVHGNTSSCGCRKREILDAVGEHLTFVSDTCVEWIRSRKTRRDNESGFRGVHKDKDKYKDKYRVSIGFQRKSYYCETYDSFEDAKAARMEVEEILHDNFVRAWDKWSAAAKENPVWAQEFPFIFDVVKENGEFKVYTPILEENEECG